MNQRIRVAAAVIIRDGLVLIGRRKEGRFLGMWENQGGKVEPGETDEEALVRELHEELGVESTVGQPLAAFYFDYSSRVGHCVITFYRVEITGDPAPLCHDRLLWVDAPLLYILNFTPASHLVRELLYDMLRQDPWATR